MPRKTGKGSNTLTIPEGNELLESYGIVPKPDPELYGDGWFWNWKKIADFLNLEVWGNSAHIAVARRYSEVHDAIPHEEPRPDYHTYTKPSAKKIAGTLDGSKISKAQIQYENVLIFTADGQLFFMSPETILAMANKFAFDAELKRTRVWLTINWDTSTKPQSRVFHQILQ